MSSEEEVADAIMSDAFGEFVPQTSTLPAVNPREFVAMAGEAVRGAWIIPHEVFRELPEKLFRIAMGNTRSAVKAAKLLVEMNSANGPAEQNDQRGEVVIFLPHNGRATMPE